MDLFEAACQGIGLSLAAGVLAGAVAATAEDERGSPGPLLLLLLAIGVLGGAYLFGASLSAEDHPAWPGWFVGGAIALFSFGIARGVVAGAAQRAGEQGSAGTIVAIASLGALVIAALSILWGPLGLLVLIALVALALGRRRQADQKHAGLRSLR
jgi:hypothetical protein